MKASDLWPLCSAVSRCRCLTAALPWIFPVMPSLRRPWWHLSVTTVSCTDWSLASPPVKRSSSACVCSLWVRTSNTGLCNVTDYTTLRHLCHIQGEVLFESHLVEGLYSSIVTESLRASLKVLPEASCCDRTNSEGTVTSALWQSETQKTNDRVVLYFYTVDNWNQL